MFKGGFFMTRNFSFILRSLIALTFTIAVLFLGYSSFAGVTKGTLSFPKGTMVFKYSYLVKGPDSFDNKKIIRRIVFTGNDIGAKIQACNAMNCVDGLVTEGMIIDLDVGPRLNYWMVLNQGLVQYSGTHEPTALKSTVDQPKQLSGKLNFDDGAAGGPKVDVDFDAVLVKEFTQTSSK
jgi:hypothetical protein